jgi:antitoxin CcdA
MRIQHAHKEHIMQRIVFDASASKKSTNLSINSDLLQQAKEHRINLSQTLELRLAEILRDEKRRNWQEENREAMEEYNRRIEARGVFSDGQRQF